MAIYADNNLYPGINIHLNSFLQNEPGGWESFHADHVTHLREALDEHLPEGYYTRSEKSLQISEFDAGTGAERRTGTRPDVTVYQAPGSAKPHTPAQESSTPAETIPITATFEEENILTGLVIYQMQDGNLLGKAVTRIELLSPANKPPGSHHKQYVVRRMETLESSLNLMEIDYLHESRPVIRALSSYPDGDEGAYPYTILVSDPRPTLDEGRTDIYGFGVDAALPVINIPLAGDDVVKIDFGAVYNYTFESARFYRLIVDYEQEPVNFERYSDADRERITEMLAEIRNKQRET